MGARWIKWVKLWKTTLWPIRNLSGRRLNVIKLQVFLFHLPHFTLKLDHGFTYNKQILLFPYFWDILYMCACVDVQYQLHGAIPGSCWACHEHFGRCHLQHLHMLILDWCTKQDINTRTRTMMITRTSPFRAVVVVVGIRPWLLGLARVSTSATMLSRWTGANLFYRSMKARCFFPNFTILVSCAVDF